ncbi:hypothetical protein HPP92_024564 [Vanilla planifolia]|uniref:Pentatricopeptide repeat-containing protein n=1 Tax=Vanilla planifolia TaxID=51239 RepID=A0A835UB98_VANPL|nr:hypothetical protein HPP92_024564 [Vanilla planifolia]
MLVACRRLLHLPSIRYNSPLELIAIPRYPTLSHGHHRLSPEIVDSTVSNCPSDTIALSFFLWAARQPEYFHAPTSFDRITPVVRRLSHRFGLVSGIVRHLESFGCPIKAQTFLILLRVYWRANMCRFALEVFDTMCRRNYVPNTFSRNIVLDIMFKRGCFDDAMSFFREFPFPNFLTYNIVLRSICKSGDWIKVRDLLREMVGKGFHLNEGSFSMALDCFCKAGRHSELLQLFASIIVLGRRLSVIMWTILIDSQCRNKRFEIALDHMRNMIEAGFLPTVVTFTSVIKGLADAKMFGENPQLCLRCLHASC